MEDYQASAASTGWTPQLAESKQRGHRDDKDLSPSKWNPHRKRVEACQPSLISFLECTLESRTGGKHSEKHTYASWRTPGPWTFLNLKTCCICWQELNKKDRICVLPSDEELQFCQFGPRIYFTSVSYVQHSQSNTIQNLDLRNNSQSWLV
jgi:hypothetical protein